ncbi:MAG TPA: DNA-binding domain-containing protein [Polyangia bacterium]|jgi:hypothetical protein|nr:DNA-binding domain-containing protein [Polyangia bacterium]
MAEKAWPPALAALQDRFYGLVTAPESVAATLLARGQTPAALDGFVIGDDQLSGAERLDIYANMYFFRILDVLRDAYPKVVAAVGDAGFHNLITEYLVACPPAHHSIARAGDRLPAFLERHALCEARPWLAELAVLERQYVELFDGPDSVALTVEQLRSLTPAEITTLALAPVPCHAVLANEFAIADLWARLDAGGEAGEVSAAPEAMVVWRQDITVYHRRLDDDELPLLRLVQAGTTIAALCDVVGQGSGDVEQAALRVFALLHCWVKDGLLRDHQHATQ